MIETPPFCPQCGCNFVADAPVELDGWKVTTYGAGFGQAFSRLTSSEAILLHSVATMRGAAVHASVLAERIGYDGDNNVVQVLVSRIRRKVPGVPLETVWGQGYRWSGAAQVLAA